MPGGAIYVGSDDHLFNFAWTGFLFFLAAVFIRFSDKRRLELVFGICVLGLVLCTPALAVARSVRHCLAEPCILYGNCHCARRRLGRFLVADVMARRFGGPQFSLLV